MKRPNGYLLAILLFCSLSMILKPNALSAQEIRKNGSSGTFNPASFIRIYEDTRGGVRKLIYDPTLSQATRGTQLSVDYMSTLVIVPDLDPNIAGYDLPLNKLYMSAVLSSEDKNQTIEVTGYSEVGKDKATMAAQRGMAFETTANITNLVMDMAYTAWDIVTTVAQTDRSQSVYEQSNKIKIEQTIKDMQQAVVDKKDIDAMRLARDRFALYKPEIGTISAFFADPENVLILQILGKEIFWMDTASLVQVAKQYQDTLSDALDPSKPDALVKLMERSWLIVQDFHELIEQANDRAKSSDCTIMMDKRGCGIDKIAEDKRKSAFDILTKLFAPGSISLQSAKAADGNLLTLTVTAVGKDGGTAGIPAVFEISIKKYGAKIQWSPSLLFVRRLGVTNAEVTPSTGSTTAPLNRVNFAASPGMTFGIAYFKRGESAGTKFLRALGPGLGMNVTFMNFNDPSYDLTTGKFVNTTGTNVQVGAGVITSLFDNKIQFSYGANLNVEHRRTYFGVGFGFIEVGKELAKYIGK
jgi:hypothetical protein